MKFKHIRATSSQSKSTHKSGASQAKLDHMLHENALECRACLALRWRGAKPRYQTKSQILMCLAPTILRNDGFKNAKM